MKKILPTILIILTISLVGFFTYEFRFYARKQSSNSTGKKTANLSGYVISYDSNKAVSGALISLHPYADMTRGRGIKKDKEEIQIGQIKLVRSKDNIENLEPIKQDDNPTTSTDLSGRFEISDLIQGYYEIEIEHGDFVSFNDDVLVNEASKETVFKLHKGGTISIHTVDNEGNSVPFLPVTVHTNAGFLNKDTDEYGIAIIGRIPEGLVTLSAENTKRGVVKSIRRAIPKEDVTKEVFSFGTGYKISGILKKDSKAFSNAEIFLIGQSQEINQVVTSAKTITDLDGKFEFDDISTDQYKLVKLSETKKEEIIRIIELRDQNIDLGIIEIRK